MAPKTPLKIDQAGRERVETGLYVAHTTTCERRIQQSAKAPCHCKRYYAQVPAGESGKVTTHTITAETREQARIANAELRVAESKARQARPVAKRPSSGVSLTDVFLAYAEWRLHKAPKRWSGQTYVQRLSDWEIRVHPWLGSWAVEDVTNTDIKEWWSEINSQTVRDIPPREKKAGEGDSKRHGHRRRAPKQRDPSGLRWNASTRNRCRSLLSAVLDYAVNEAGYAIECDRDFVLRLETATDQTTRSSRTEIVVSRDEIIALSKATTTPHQEALILALGLMGLRKAEACALTWGRVNLTTREVLVDRSARWIAEPTIGGDGVITVKRQYRAVEGQVKTTRSRGTVSIPKEVVAALKRIKPENPDPDDHVWPGRRQLESGKWVDDASIQISRKTPNQIVERAILRLNDPTSDAYTKLGRKDKPTFPEDFTPHNFRHSFGTGLVRSGVDTVRTAKAMRNRAETVQRTYLHDRPDDDLRDAMDAWQ